MKTQSENDLRKMYFLGITEETQMCVNCKHFYQHYLQAGKGCYMKATCGHCSYPRLKPRAVYDTCSHFEKQDVG